TALAFFIAEAKRLRHPLRIFLMSALLASVLFFMRKIELPEVRMHILMYAVLGWLASRDATNSNRTVKTIVMAWLFTASAGLLEELFQKILPYRVFQISDILFNLAGASLGVTIYLIRPRSSRAL
ncbi:MAG: VanZ family protein, partial [Candidatus Omnitrophica bacterium]|nr:VanZ family protein [Candidatus Omnitrophota bacterium]